MARTSAGLSQGGLGDLVGVRGQTVYRYEADQIVPSSVVAVKIAKACGISVEFLVLGTSELS